MRIRFVDVLPLVLAILSTTAEMTAHGQSRGSPDNGLKLARQWTCHLVEPAGRGGDAGPPFVQIANRPDRTAQTLRAWLNDPHPPMPNLGLSGREVDDIAVYIESLQGRL
jgi:hypothetical protein